MTTYPFSLYSYHKVKTYLFSPFWSILIPLCESLLITLYLYMYHDINKMWKNLPIFPILVPKCEDYLFSLFSYQNVKITHFTYSHTKMWRLPFISILVPKCENLPIFTILIPKCENLHMFPILIPKCKTYICSLFSYQNVKTYPLSLFSYQNLSPSLILRNASRVISVNNGPGPSNVVSINPPTNKSTSSGAETLRFAFEYTAFNCCIAYKIY